MCDYNQYYSDCSYRDEYAPRGSDYSYRSDAYAPRGSDYSYRSDEYATRAEPLVDPLKDQKRHGNMEHIGELGAVAAGGFALWEKHRADTDPEHARRHRLEEEAAAVGALGAGGYAFHEHHQKKGAYDQGRQYSYNY